MILGAGGLLFSSSDLKLRSLSLSRAESLLNFTSLTIIAAEITCVRLWASWVNTALALKSLIQLMICERKGGSRGGRAWAVAPGLEPAWPGLCVFLDPVIWEMFTFLEKNHINILSDSYASKDKPWSSKPQKKSGHTKDQGPRKIKIISKNQRCWRKT